MMKTEFKFSSAKVGQIPAHGLPEFALIGRSNVGKSSLLNLLAGSPIAKVSSTPGKTRLINHFLVDDQWWLVDLPGYGYARTSHSERREFSKLITDYISNAPDLHFLFLLLDSRHEPLRIDLDFIEMLGREGVPFGLVFTKADKQSAEKTRSVVAAYRRTLLQSWEQMPPLFITSSAKRQGRDEIVAFIDGCLQVVNK